jgi:hypothetical protein
MVANYYSSPEDVKPETGYEVMKVGKGKAKVIDFVCFSSR